MKICNSHHAKILYEELNAISKTEEACPLCDERTLRQSFGVYMSMTLNGDSIRSRKDVGQELHDAMTLVRKHKALVKKLTTEYYDDALWISSDDQD